jgi:bifunctional DNA-binding transcriptional regulator/antitoxin component of YhaV-PrlF toxin-antitoxin module
MKAIEFKSRVTKKGIVIPDEIKDALGTLEEKVIKVIFLYEEENKEEKGLKEYALKKFLEGYDDEDMVYDSL